MVGIDKNNYICNRIIDMQIIGIWGMGDIDKITLAEEVSNKQWYEYESCYFLANKREQSSRHEIISMKDDV